MPTKPPRPSAAKANPRTLCLSSQGVSLDARDGHFLLSLDAESAPLKLPPVAVRQILVERGAGLRTRAAKLALECAIPVSFFGRHGELLGHLQPPLPPRIDLRLAQYRSHAHEGTRTGLARKLVAAKLEASSALLAEATFPIPRRTLQSVVRTLAEAKRRAAKAPDRETLRGIEGAAARAYFGALGEALPGGFPKRTRRPPLDAWNALLSYGYAVLIRDLAGKIEIGGLDPYVGYLHEPGYRSPALALDLAEPLRAALIDRLVIDLAPALDPADFETSHGGEIRIGQGAKAAFFAAYEEAVRSRDATETALPGGSLLADLADDFASALRDGRLGRWRPAPPPIPCQARP